MRRVLARLLGGEKKTPWPVVLFVIDGKTYRWSGWYGCQLESYEYRQILPGEGRVLNLGSGNGKVHRLTVFRSDREGLFNFRTTWAVSNSGTHQEHEERIQALLNDLKDLV